MKGSPPPPPIYLIQVSAIPGAGKSSALKRLEQTGMLAELLHPLAVRVAYVQEPVDLWREQGWLQAFYADPSHAACAFQLLVFDSHIEAIEAVIKREQEKEEEDDPSSPPRPLILIVERSMYDQHLFWDVQVEQRYPSTDTIHQAAYHRLWSRWRSFVPEPRLVVFLKTSDIQYTMQRLASRARVEEVGGSDSGSSEGGRGASRTPSPSPSLNASGVFLPPPTTIESVGGLTLEYQSRLYSKHCEWFTEPIARPPYLLPASEGIPCVHINVDAPYHVHDGSLRVLAEQLAAAITGMLLGGATTRK
jgi:deoxyadenosine/deoxycytidine kinase